MTSPVAHGYPDWGRQRAASDILVLNLNNVAVAGTRADGPFFVGNMPYIHVTAFSGSRTQIVLDWYADAALTISLDRDVLVTPVALDVIQCVPVRGSYLQVTTNVSVNPSNTTVRIFMMPVPFASAAGTGGDNTLISVDNVLLGAGANAVIDAQTTRGGWIHWSAGAFNSPTFFSRLYAVNFAGGQLLLDTIYYPGNAGGGMVLAPSLPLRIDITNTDVAGHTYSANVHHHPFYP